MPKKAARHAQYARDSVPKDKPKRHRSLHIGPSNGRRWISLKKRLGLLTDDQLVVYLLDLADSLAAREQESDCKDEHVQSTPVEVFQEQPRRSLRNQLAAANESPKSPHDSEQKAHSRADKPKKHKNKARHHKEKRKKRKHQKIKDEESLDNRLRDSSVPWELDSESDTEKVELHVPDEFTLENEMHQEDQEDSEGSFSSNKIEGLQKLCHNEEQPDCYDSKTDLPSDQDLASTTCVQNQRETLVVQNYCATSAEAQSKDESSKLISSSELSQPTITHSAKAQQDPKSTEDTQLAEVDFPNKKYKRSKLESGETCSVLVELDRSYCDELITSIQKRDRKKHKEHQSKKHRDVRKAPQDGIIVTDEDRDVTCSNDSVAMTATTTAEPDNPVPSEALIENPGSETPRLAIKIKLCQECNSRHLQDTCPLSEPQYIIKDSVTLEQWAQNNSENVEAMKTLSANDPMSQGYGKHGDDVFESDEEAAEQYKSKSKQECEEKQESVDINRPLYARDSLPDCLELKLSNADHGLGVYVKNPVPMYAQLGPLIGKPIQEMDIPDDFSMRHIWEIDTNSKTLYISTTNPLTSNWIRYVRPAETKDDRNVAVISKNGELFLVTSKSLTPGTELTYWSDSQSTAWTRKNKIDKTNCGGCNLTFAHPIYYRLHCCIFHDTNYSLTIRKYHCKVCGAAVLGKDNIMKHAAQLHAGRGAYQCQYCKKFFLRLNYLEMHRTYGCSQNPQRSRPLCDFCGRKFCQPQKLKVHIKRMHSDMSEVLREFQCKLCLKLLGSRAALQRHMKEVHHKDVVGAATCDRCGKMFQNKSNLKIHMLTHSGVKPFKCKENGCKAAFTTKQCLQFHYKKVHGLSEDAMPKIERSVAYTFDAYSGGLVEDAGRGKIPKFNKNNSQENSDSLASFDDGSSENNNSSSVPVEMPCSTNSEQLQVSEEPGEQLPVPVPAQMAPADSPTGSVESDIDIYGAPRLPSKTSKKWLGEFDPPPCASPPPPNADIYDFQDAGRREEEKLQPPSLIDETKLGLGMFRRTESSNASLLVEAALDAAEREIGAVSSPILEDSDREANLYSIQNELDFKVSNCPPMTVVHRSPLPPSDSHIESYMHEDLVPTSPGIPHPRHSPPGPHAHLDYHLHRPMDYVPGSSRTHSIEQYLDQQELQRVIHVSQEVPSSPSRYQEIPHPHSHLIHHHHHQLAVNDALSSDEGDSVAQNLSLPVKEKSLQQQQLEMAKYDGLESEFALVNRERVRFEPLIVQSSSDQGLDMSARGLQQAFGSQVQSHHLHHHHHLYEMSERERQGVDLSRTSACMSPPSYPPPYPPYSHVEVPRVVSLEPASRPHHLHTSVSRIIASPQPASSLTSHLVPESLETRILSPPPPAMSAYNSTYPVGPAPYHTSRSGYHYSGYY